MEVLSMKTTIGALMTAAVLTTGTLAAGVTAAPAAAAIPSSPATLVAATVPAQALPSWPVLRQGPNSIWPKVTVRSLQYLLNAHGAKLTVDGAFGPRTRAALVAFQRAHHLTADGVARTATWQALVVPVHAGSTGPAVRAVQDQANFRNLRGTGQTLTVDGIFGPKTQAWVLAFQHVMSLEVHGFPVNGTVGTLTWQALVTEALSG
jgi:peptidoglycan hydrolase-like protein with peptidoglycan-binding domain